MKNIIIIYSTIAFCCLIVCKTDSDSNKKGRIDRLDDAVERLITDPTDTVGINQDALSIYMQMMGADADTPLIEAVDSFAATAAFNIFHEDVKSQHKMFESLEKPMKQLNYKIISTIGLNKPLEFYGIVSPYSQQIIRDDNCIYIALNHYLGEAYPGYNGLPQYIRRMKSPERIPVDVAEAFIATEFPYRPSNDATTLNRLLYEGALMNAISEVTGRNIGDILGWSEEDLKMVTDNESKIWAKLISDELLYSDDAGVASRLVDPAPATTILSADMPGRVGRYIGYAIVNAYLKNNKATTRELLSPEFYNTSLSLIKSNYHG